MLSGEVSPSPTSRKMFAVREGPGTRRLILVAAAVAGVVAAHALDYLAVSADGAERARHLHITGHGYWSGAVALAISGAVVATAIAASWGARRAPGRADGGSDGPVIGFVPLTLAQVGLFAGMEVAERVLAGAEVSELVHGPLFALGLVLQAVVAATAVLVLRLVSSGAERIAARAVRPSHRSPRVTRPSADAPMPGTAGWGASGCRGPPRLAPS